MGQWFIRYLHPSEAGWKQIVDHFILYSKHGELKYTERRGIVISKLAPYEKLKIMGGIPRTAKYLRKCLSAFWNFKLRPAKTAANEDKIGSMSLWRNHFFDVQVDFGEKGCTWNENWG